MYCASEYWGIFVSKTMRTRNRLFAPIDMTEGAPWKNILAFMIPMLLGNIAQQMYNAVDSIVVGRYMGDNALAAVGNAGPIVNLLIVLFVGISMGASIVVAQYLGAKNREALSGAIGNCLILTAISVLAVMTLAVLFTRPLLEVMNTPDSIMQWCESYLLIMLVGSVGLAYYNILSGILRGLGDSVSALVYLLAACGLNIVLDILFVAGFHMGVAGAAWATILSQAVSAVLCMGRLMHMQEFFNLSKKHIKWNKKYAWEIVRMGVPSGLTQVIMSMSMLVVQSLTNSFGETVIAANVIVSRVDGFAGMPALSFGTAATTYAGQNVGAGKYQRVKKGAVQGNILAAGISAAIMLFLLVFGKPLMAVFTNTEELIQMSYRYMCILSGGYILFAVIQCLCGIMRGAGDPMATMWISVAATFLVRLPLAYLMTELTKSPQTPLGSPESLYFSQLVAWVFGLGMTVVLYRKGKCRYLRQTT